MEFPQCLELPEGPVQEQIEWLVNYLMELRQASL